MRERLLLILGLLVVAILVSLVWPLGGVPLSAQGETPLGAQGETPTPMPYHRVTIEPTADDKSGNPGETVSYTLHVTNTGNMLVHCQGLYK